MWMKPTKLKLISSLVVFIASAQGGTECLADTVSLVDFKGGYTRVYDGSGVTIDQIDFTTNTLELTAAPEDEYQLQNRDYCFVDSFEMPQSWDIIAHDPVSGLISLRMFNVVEPVDVAVTYLNIDENYTVKLVGYSITIPHYNSNTEDDYGYE